MGNGVHFSHGAHSVVPARQQLGDGRDDSAVQVLLQHVHLPGGQGVVPHVRIHGRGHEEGLAPNGPCTRNARQQVVT